MLSLLKVTNMFLTNDDCTFVFGDVLKYTRPNSHPSRNEFKIDKKYACLVSSFY